MLRLLVGTDLPADLPQGLPLDRQPVLTVLPAGLPSDLLTRRPDIRQAEQAMVAANADIGAARAAFFPRISLTASLGYASPAMSGLFDGQHRIWSFSPQIVQPLFQGGRHRMTVIAFVYWEQGAPRTTSLSPPACSMTGACRQRYGVAPVTPFWHTKRTLPNVGVSCILSKRSAVAICSNA